MNDHASRPTLGTRVKILGKHLNPYGVIEAYEHPGFASRAFIVLDIPADGYKGYWCELFDFEVLK